jgi:hypothetical protein
MIMSFVICCELEKGKGYIKTSKGKINFVESIDLATVMTKERALNLQNRLINAGLKKEILTLVQK